MEKVENNELIKLIEIEEKYKRMSTSFQKKRGIESCVNNNSQIYYPEPEICKIICPRSTNNSLGKGIYPEPEGCKIGIPR